MQLAGTGVSTIRQEELSLGYCPSTYKILITNSHLKELAFEFTTKLLQ
jgi:hypothetical protein